MSWPQGSLSSTQPHPHPPGQAPCYTVGKEHTTALTQPTLVVSEHSHTQPWARWWLAHCDSRAEVGTETPWPAKPKTFTTWPFPEFAHLALYPLAASLSLCVCFPHQPGVPRARHLGRLVSGLLAGPCGHLVPGLPADSTFLPEKC